MTIERAERFGADWVDLLLQQKSVAGEGGAKGGPGSGNFGHSGRPGQVGGSGEGGGGESKPLKQTDTPEFKRWFGNSKVVDDEGEPLVVYHGAPLHINPTGDVLGDLTEFDRNAVSLFSGSGLDIGMDKVGHWFTDTPGERGAELYSGKTGTIYPIYLSIKNPWGVTFDEFLKKGQTLSGWDKLAREYRKRTGRNLPEGRWDVKPLRSWMKDNGFDGIQFKGVIDNPTQKVWLTLEPTQIKSATGNRGTFDPDDPDITKSVKSPSASSLVRRIFDPTEWKAELVNRILPVMVVRMAEAAAAELITAGVDVRKKGMRRVDGKGGPGSGSWNGPGDPRFAYDGRNEELKIPAYKGFRVAYNKSRPYLKSGDITAIKVVPKDEFRKLPDAALGDVGWYDPQTKEILFDSWSIMLHHNPAEAVAHEIGHAVSNRVASEDPSGISDLYFGYLGQVSVGEQFEPVLEKLAQSFALRVTKGEGWFDKRFGNGASAAFDKVYLRKK